MDKLRNVKRRHFLSILLVMTVSIAIYANTLKNGFVYDDRDSIVNNTLIKDFGNWPKLFTQEYFDLSWELSYRPVVTFSYFFDYAFFGMKAWGYHLINILLHAANGALAYIFLSLIVPMPDVNTGGKKESAIFPEIHLLTALLFVTAPIMTEAVNAVSYREDLLSFLFYIATLNIYLLLRSSNLKPLLTGLLYGLSCLLYFLALLSKEMAASLPLIVFCYEVIYGDMKKRLSSFLLNPYNIGYIAVTVVYLYLRFFYFHNPHESQTIRWPLSERLITVSWLFLNYLKLTVFPVSLSADYLIQPVRSFFSISFLFPSVAVIALIATVFMRKKLERGVAFGVIFFTVTLLPVYNIIPIVNPLAERYLYLPALGLCLVMGLFIYGMKLGTRSLSIIFLAIISVYVFSTVNRNAVWRDDYSLWSDVARKVPKSARPYNDIGNVFYEKGRLEDAVKQYQTAIRLKPDYLEPHNNLGMIFSEEGRFDDAARELTAALKIDPKHAVVRLNLANTYGKQGKLDEAVNEFKTLIKMNPNEPQYHYALGDIYDRQHRDEAIEEFKIAININPGFVDAHYYLGIIYLKRGMKDEARKELETVVKLNPGSVRVRQLLESLNRERGDR